jgi:hypothetical protein
MLYSEEYFELVKSRLRPGGMAVTWLPTPRVAATMRKVFPHLLVVGDVIGIGTQEPLRVHWTWLQERVDMPQIWSYFRSTGIDLHALLMAVAGPRARITRLEADLFPKDEWLLPSLLKKAYP